MGFNCIGGKNMLTLSREIIQVDPDVMSGAPVFPHTRVLIQNFFDYLETGETIFSFLKDFPTVEEKQILDLLTYLKTIALKESAV
ncbi:MAG TPA: DUF433 domain-containing protein [Leptospiraceae bacterium]|nr:DUF433 domain-containing protein [Leptospiraceae bacterium]